MSTILYDKLSPLIGPEAAAYWAQMFVVDPL
jgi:hypothetical protein